MSPLMTGIAQALSRPPAAGVRPPSAALHTAAESSSAEARLATARKEAGQPAQQTHTNVLPISRSATRRRCRARCPWAALFTAAEQNTDVEALLKHLTMRASTAHAPVHVAVRRSVTRRRRRARCPSAALARCCATCRAWRPGWMTRCERTASKRATCRCCSRISRRCPRRGCSSGEHSFLLELLGAPEFFSLSSALRWGTACLLPHAACLFPCQAVHQ